MKKPILLSTGLLLFQCLTAQAKDTTSSSYELGKKVGSYIPAVIILGLAIWTIAYFIRKSKK